jgi:hypothetical protein
MPGDAVQGWRPQCCAWGLSKDICSYIVSCLASWLPSAVRSGAMSLMAGAVLLLKRFSIRNVPEAHAKEVEEDLRWLLCGGAQGLEELVCRSMLEVSSGAPTSGTEQACPLCRWQDW